MDRTSSGTTVHGLVNNAGVPYRARLLTMDLAGGERVIGINLTGAMLGMRTIAPLMPADGTAAIVNIGSIAGLTAHFAIAYTASKWGLRGLTKAAALELAPRGIRVNIVHPGPIDTPILDGSRTRVRRVERGQCRCSRAARDGPRKSATWSSSCCRTERRTSTARRSRWTAAIPFHARTEPIVDALARAHKERTA